MVSFLPLIDNSVTAGLSFLLLSISAIISSKTINIYISYLDSSIFLKISSISFEYSIKALESLKCFKFILSRLLIKNWYFASYGSLAYK